ncbi:hypothetical protein [Bifidobacterium sp. ESL0745]|uniref:hypothetical protein n=1 Tax=Bifidobacterium sp. ESL0745 TaxID=2983226 RepID=UPI0023FA26BE|nr:hypothetical protein [Bifidobacterium sp. ESL0745]MDF7665712.1 hypothetical protein [Bifidobacterium sp. ESL0745]
MSDVGVVAHEMHCDWPDCNAVLSLFSMSLFPSYWDALQASAEHLESKYVRYPSWEHLKDGRDLCPAHAAQYEAEVREKHNVLQRLLGRNES